MKTIRVLVALLFAAPVGTAHAQQFAADLPPSVPAASPSFQGYGDRDATCLAWTDDCRTCRREGAAVTCSNIGIACQPGRIKCTARQDGQNPGR